MTAAVSVQVGIDSISAGALFAVLALGLALLFGVMRLLNFAYGELVTITGYAMLVAGSLALSGLVRNAPSW